APGSPRTVVDRAYMPPLLSADWRRPGGIAARDSVLASAPAGNGREWPGARPRARLRPRPGDRRLLRRPRRRVRRVVPRPGPVRGPRAPGVGRRGRRPGVAGAGIASGADAGR